VAAPDLTIVTEYLGDEVSATEEEITGALAAEKAAQAARCVVPADDAAWPADLAEALCRRVHRNLVMRGLPLGLSTTMSEATVSVTRVGMDPEVVRLEAPYRRLVVG
jgi:hypothetical protein